MATTLAICAIFGIILTGVHYWQMQRIAGALLTRADQLHADKDWRKAADSYYQYLSLRPADAHARTQLADSFARSNPAPNRQSRVIDLYYRALGANTTDLALRRELAQRLLQQTRYTAALEQTTAILESDPEDAVALRVQAWASEALRLAGRRALEEDARKQLLRAAAANETDVALLSMIAVTLRQQSDARPSDAAVADRLIDGLVEKLATDPRAWLARHRYRQKFGLAGTEEDLAHAEQLSPRQIEVVIAAAEFALARQDFDAAFSRAQQLLEMAPRLPLAWQLLGDSLLGQQKSDEALQAWNKGLAFAATSPELHARLATALLARSKAKEAEPHLLALEHALLEMETSPGAQRSEFHNFVRMLRVQSLLQSGNWSQAAPLLRDVALSPPGKSDHRQRLEAWNLLAARESAQQRWDLSADFLQRAVQLDPASGDLRLKYARALGLASQWTQALRQINVARQLKSSALETELLSAQLNLAIQSRLPAADRSLEAFDEALAAATKADADDPRVLMLQVARPFVKGTSEERIAAQARLVASLDTLPPDLLVQSATLLEHLNDRSSADQALRQALAAAPDNQRIRLFEVEILAHRREVEAAASKLKALEGSLSGADLHNAARLWLQLESLDKHPERVREHWQRLAKQSPEDLRLRLILAEEALDRADTVEAAAYEDELKRLEGDSGSAWRYVSARRLLAKSPRSAVDDQRLRELTDWLITRRPNWTKTWLLAGVLAEAQGNVDRAISAWQQAISLDGSQLPVLERLVKLLYQRGRFSEVDRFLATLAASGPLSPEASLIAIGSAAAQHDLDHALHLARAAHKKDPERLDATLWLAHLCQTSGEREEAYALLSKLVEEQPKSPQAWSGLLAYYQAAGDRRQFAATLERCEQAEIPAQQKALLLAQGYQLLGRAEQSIGHYRSALAKDPDNTDLKFRLATVLLGFDPAQAEVLLRELRRQLPQSVAARRLLAIALASHRSESAWPEIKDLLTPGEGPDGDDLRLAAMLRLQQQDPSQAAEARQLFERAAQRSAKTTAQDLMILALLCEQQQDLAAARRYVDSALRKPDASPAHLAQAAEFHLRQREHDAALKLCDQLDQAAPGDWGVRRLRAMALHAAVKQPELEALLQECEQTILKQPAAEQAMLRVGFAQIYDSLQDAEHAEAQLRSAVALDEKRIGELTSWLLRAKQPEAALQACLELAEQKPSAAAQLAVVQVLSRAEIESVALRNRAEDCIRNSIAASKDASVLIALAELRLAQKNHDEAVKLFERAIASAPEHYLALNNIAALLADRVGQQQLALQYIDRALAAAPQRYPFLCDTRAKVLLYAGQPEAAIRELEALLERAPQSDPRFHAHLAFAYADAGRERQARQALVRANEQGLKLDDLTPGDRQRLRALDAQLASAKSASNSTEPATP